MTDRTVSVALQAKVSSYLAGMSAASKATVDLANKVDLAKGRAAEGYAAIGKGMMVAGGLVGIGVGVAVKEMAGFEARMAQVRSLAQDASQKDLRDLSDAAMTVGTAFGFSADEAADAEIELTKAGISAADMLGGALKGALTLAAAGQTDVASATETAAIAMTQFQLKGKDVPHIADLLAAGADRALGSVGDLSYGLRAGGLVAAQFGESIEETVGTLSAFAQAGLIGEQGGTVLKQMLIQLASPSKQASDIMSTLGIKVYDTTGKFVGLANLAGQLRGKMSGLTQAERDHALAVIFGSRAIQGANVLYQLGAQGIKDWTDKVNVSGFAALQAAGKMNSLSGDVQKLGAEIQDAFIGAGENANGPLRELVQDVTEVVHAWNQLPGPLKEGIELFVTAGGVAVFAGGAFLTFVPKIKAVQAALKGVSVDAVSTRAALGGLAKAGVVVGTFVGIYEGAKALGDALNKTVTPSVEDTTTALISLQQRGADGVEWLEHMAHFAKIAKESGLGTGDAFKNTDQALADLVTNGHLDVAQDDFNDLQRYLTAAGYSTDQITKLFPNLSSALKDSANSAKLAGDGVDQYGNSVDASGKAMRSAADAAKGYNDALHALTDPVFSFQQAIADAKTKQAAYNKAVAEYGAHSKQARAALSDVAQATANVTTNANALTAALKDNPALVKEFTDQLQKWKSQGLITGSEMDALKGQLGGLLGQAHKFDDFTPTMKPEVDTSQARGAFSWLFNAIGRIPPSKTFTLYGKTVHIPDSPSRASKGSHNAYGGWVGGFGGSTTDDVTLHASTGEYVVKASQARANGALLEAINSGQRVDVTRARPASGGSSAPQAVGHTFNTTVNYPEPEKASESVPRVLRDAAFVHGASW